MHLKGACFLSRQWGDPHRKDDTIEIFAILPQIRAPILALSDHS